MPLNVIVTTALLVVFSTICNGLQLQFDPILSSKDKPQTSCGVLTCLEISQPQAKDVKKSGLTQAAVGTEKIYSLSLYKTSRDKPAPGGVTDGGAGSIKEAVITETFVGRVTEAKKTLSISTENLTVSGELTPDKALLSLELFTHDVCPIETFTCLVHIVDSSGAIHARQLSTQVNGHHSTQNLDIGRHQSASNEDFKLGQNRPSDTKSWVLDGTIHLIGLVEQLQLKMAVMEQNVDKIKVQGQLLDEIKDKSVIQGQLLGEIKDKSVIQGQLLDEIKDKSVIQGQLLDEIKDKSVVLDAIMQKVSGIDSIKDKVSSIQDIRDKVLVMDAKLSSMEGVKDKLMNVNEKLAEIQASREITPTLDKLQANMSSVKLEVGKRLSGVTEELTRFRESITDLVVDSMASANDNITSRITVGLSKYESRDNHIDALIDKVEIWFDNVTSVIRDGLQDNLQMAETQRNTMEDLVLTWNNRSATCDLYQTVVTDVKNLESSLKNVIEPPACDKGMHALDRYITIPANQLDILIQVPFLCDTVTLGGGWIVFQRRVTGDVDFYRGWQDYKTGFGSLTSDYWLGLENIYKLTSSGKYELRIDLKYNGKSAYAQYAKFSVASEIENYKLFVASYSGTAGDSLARHSGKMFTTRDRDNDPHSTNCAVDRTGAWWYDACTDSNLNGKWKKSEWKGLTWEELSRSALVDSSEMKMRKVT